MKIILNIYVKFHFSTFYYSAKVGIMPDYFLCYLSHKRLNVLLDQSSFSQPDNLLVGDTTGDGGYLS